MKGIIMLHRSSFLAVIPALVWTIGTPALADTNVGRSEFSGIVDHVSVQNIKVTDPKTHESLSFIIVPKFNRVFSEDGKTTYQMSELHPGMFVRVFYDQKFIGMRHADRIIILRRR
jgi:hypothetical protein